MTISSTVLDRAEICFHTAAPSLQSFVGCFWIITAQAGATVRAVPDGTASLSIEYSSPQHYEGHLRGPLLRPMELRFSIPTTVIGVRLRPGVAYMLGGAASHELLDRRIPLAECAPLRELASLDPMPQTHGDWVGALQQFLMNRLANASLHPVVAAALEEMHREQGSVPIAQVAARCGVSERHLGRLMRDWVGYGSKQYAAVVRFQSTLMRMEQAPAKAASTLATDSGYFDQAHLSADVGRYAGATPGRLKSKHVSEFSKTLCDVPF